MKKLLLSLFTVHCSLFIALAVPARAADEKFLSCGPGFILTDAGKTDGINTAECQKLWCRDLENGKSMGSGSKAASGYKITVAPIELCDVQNHCVSCFGDRKWCGAEVAGVWNPEFGAYTRGGNDNNTYRAVQKGDCFGWQLEKPECAAGETAILQGDEWICATASGAGEATRASSVRRTGALKYKK
ncbi:MAG: hypothetical protein LBJ18_00720 [Rickettsiales bacterium]|jgi:hypothetical protein|nr:hypothetical protein [Rickettsiales bacterium]